MANDGVAEGCVGNSAEGPAFLSRQGGEFFRSRFGELAETSAGFPAGVAGGTDCRYDFIGICFPLLRISVSKSHRRDRSNFVGGTVAALGKQA